MLQEGDPAPDFALPDAEGNIVKLSDSRGRFAVVYFISKGRTRPDARRKRSISPRSRRNSKSLAPVFGFADGVKSHAKFRDKHALGTFFRMSRRLLSKPTAFGRRRRCTAGLHGRRTLHISHRPGRKNRRCWRAVKVPGHAAQVLDALKKRQ